MNGSRSNPPRPSRASPLDALNRSIEGLEARIEGLMASSAHDPRALAERRGDRGPTRGTEPMPGRDIDRRFDPVSEIRKRQQAIEAGRSSRPIGPASARAVERPQAPTGGHRDTQDLAGEITQALLGLRQDLKKDISEGFARELGLLRSEIQGLKSVAADRQTGEAVRADMTRLAASIDRLGQQSSPAGETLRAEFEELRSLIDGLAREESVRGIESRWNGIENRLDTLGEGNRAWLKEEVDHLYDRLDEIKGQLTAIGDGRMIRALEDKLLAVAKAIEDIGGHFDPSGRVLKDQFAGLDTRLDEISRAIVAGNSRVMSPAIDPRLIERLEDRIAAIATQIDRLSDGATTQAGPTDNIAHRLEGLSARIEELVDNRGAAHLEERLDQLSEMIERGPQQIQQPELTDYLFEISRKIDALEQNAVNDRLAGQFDHLARLIEHLGEATPVVQGPDLSGLEQQIARLVDHLEQPAPAVIDDRALRNVEDRLSQIAERLDETTRAPAGELPDLSGLEQQIARLSSMINAGSQAGASDPALSERIAKIEDYVATSDEYILEAARQAAETVMESYTRRGSGGADSDDQMRTIAALADNLRHLEDLSRGSEERNQRTFESLQETLLQIADRLDSLHSDHDDAADPSRASGSAMSPASFGMEDRGVAVRAKMPTCLSVEALGRLESAEVAETGRTSIDAPSLDAVSDTALVSVDDVGDLGVKDKKMVKPSLLAGLGKRLRPGQRKDGEQPAARQHVDPAPSIDPAVALEEEYANELLEPGSGTPDVRKILERVRASKAGNGSAGNPSMESDGDRTDYIAAARRAAQAAAQETSRMPASIARGEAPGAGGASAFSRYRRPILLAAGAILLAVMAMPLVKTLIQGQPAPTIETAAPIAETPVTEAMPEIAPESAAIASASAEAAQPAPDADAAVIASGQTEALNAPPKDLGEQAQATEAAESPTIADSLEPEKAELAPSVPTYEVPASIEPASLAKAAAEGDPLAFFEIGSRYTEGRGLPTDLAEAARWYGLSADKGFAPAQYRLASFYEKGTGVQQDLGVATQYYEKAATAGNASAMHNLAVLYASGAGGEQDYAKATEWFGKAAEFGVSDSQFNLAILYARGNGVPQDLEASYKWFTIAARDGDTDAAQKRDEVAKVLTPERLEALRTEAEAWQPQPLDVDANAVNIPDEWAGKGTITGSVVMKKAVRNIQAILNKNGFDAGTPDGVMGKKTEAAIKAFQTSVGLEPNGQVNDALVKELLARNK